MNGASVLDFEDLDAFVDGYVSIVFNCLIFCPSFRLQPTRVKTHNLFRAVKTALFNVLLFNVLLKYSKMNACMIIYMIVGLPNDMIRDCIDLYIGLHLKERQ